MVWPESLHALRMRCVEPNELNPTVLKHMSSSLCFLAEWCCSCCCLANSIVLNHKESKYKGRTLEGPAVGDHLVEVLGNIP